MCRSLLFGPLPRSRCAQIKIYAALLRPLARLALEFFISAPRGGAIQSDAALRQSTEGRQMAAATLSVGVLLEILEAAPEIRVPFRVDSHHSSKLGGKSQGGRRDRNQPYRESPQRDCITLDRTPLDRAALIHRNGDGAAAAGETASARLIHRGASAHRRLLSPSWGRWCHPAARGQ